MTVCKCDAVTQMSGNAGTEYARAHLTQIKVDDVNWRVLHRCPLTGKYWKEYSPFPEAHGGGPPEFVQISAAQAQEEFGVSDPSAKTD